MSWETKPLGELGRWTGGGTPSKSRPEYWAGDIPWLSPKDMGPAVIHDTKHHISPDAVGNSSTKLIPENAVAVVARSGILEHSLPTAIVKTQVTLNQDMKALSVGPGIEPAWILWGLRAHEHQILTSCRKAGTTVASLNWAKFKAFRLPVPNLAEQRRLVDLIEEHLCHLDAADATGLTARRRVASMRRAMLQSVAAQGHLVPIRTLLLSSIGGVWGKGPGEAEVDVQVARVTELRAHGELDFSTAARRSITLRELQSRRLRPGDLLLEKSGGGPKTPVGRVGLVREVGEQPIVCANFMQLMRPDPERVIPRYLHLLLTAFHASGRTERMQVASTNIRNIKASEYLQQEIGIVDLPNQRQLLSQVEPLLEQCDALAAVVEQQTARSAALRRAVLAAAFSGRLTGHASDSDVIEETAASLPSPTPTTATQEPLL